MTLEELKIELNKLGLIESDYSLNEGLKPDALIIEEFHGKWRFFYYDEKGEESDQALLNDEDEAYEYLLNKFKEDLQLLGKDKFR